MHNDNCKLYLISPPSFNLEDFEHELREAFKGGPIAAFQLRMKNKDTTTGQFIAPPDADEVAKAIDVLMPICRDHDCVFILNDNVHLALKKGCDGVHLGGDDMSIIEARKLLGKNFVIGASCYDSKDRAFTAGEQGSDYIAFGAFYDTETKTPKGRPTLDLLEFWRDYTNIPCVAIGGIKVENCKPIIEAGADFIAVVTGVWNYNQGALKAVKDFNKCFNATA